LRLRWIQENWPLLAIRVLSLLSSMVRTRIVGLERLRQGSNYVAAHWHGDDMALLPHFGHLGPTILMSESRDGESLARAAGALGYRIVRGSSSRRGAAGLLALIKAVREGHSAVLTVDGPRGPRGVCKPGIVRLAQKTGAPLFPVGVATSRRFVFEKSWSKTYLPLPFGRQVILLGDPLYFHEEKSADGMERGCRRVEEALRVAHDDAARILDAWAGAGDHDQGLGQSTPPTIPPAGRKTRSR
jgi:hypothetical protein